jgi:cytokinin dehydrogenase
MTQPLDRRRFLRALGAAAVITAFDPLHRRWLTSADAASGDPVPALDGELVTSEEALDAAQIDSGFMLSRRPWAVLRPGSLEDVSTMVRYCRKHKITVAARGAGHSVFGQPLVTGGLVIAMDTLSKAHSIGPKTADVDAGMRWGALLDRALEKGLTPPLFTGYVNLSLGGTLSVGGVSTRNDQGAQVDRARALQVVTGTGEVVWCSETKNKDLFEAILGGFGQFGVITRVVVDLIRGPKNVRHWSLSYLDPHAFFADYRAMLGRGEAEHIWGQVGPPGSPTTTDPSPLRTLANTGVLGAVGPVTGPLLRVALEPGGPVVTAVSDLAPAGQWIYQLNVAKYFEKSAPDASEVLRAMSDLAPLRQMSDQSWRDFTLNVDALVDMLKTLGMWEGVPHPWIDNLLPGDTTESFVIDTLSDMNFEELGAAGIILVFMMKRSTLTRPSFVMPGGTSAWVALFDILTSAPAPGPNAKFVKEKLARNRKLYESARKIGGKVYPISAVKMSRKDWVGHYGPTRYPLLQQLKKRYDPDGIMGADLAIF